MEVFLSIINSKGEKRVVKLPDFPVRIGRGAENHIVVPDDLCSTKHLIISKTKNEVLIKDLNSKNGVSLNGIKIFNQKFYIGDKIMIGTTSIQIEKIKLCQIALAKLAPRNKNRSNGEITIELELSRNKISPKSKPIDLAIHREAKDDEDYEDSETQSKLKKVVSFFKRLKKH